MRFTDLVDLVADRMVDNVKRRSPSLSKSEVVRVVQTNEFFDEFINNLQEDVRAELQNRAVAIDLHRV